MKILLLLTLFYTSALWADSMKVSLSTKRPVIGEEFSLRFEIDTQSSVEPDITFTPYNVEVLGKSSNGLSIRTTVINGKFTTKRTMGYVYRLIVPKPGTFRINEIKVKIGNETLTRPNITGSALKEALKPKPLFALAIPSKTEVYKGEGITVDYYLYFKLPVRGIEIEKFPKLNKFIKRFRNPTEKIERVEYRGELFQRIKKYSARIYPQKVGKLYIDPITLRAVYQDNRSGVSILGMGRMKQRSLHSPKVEINVLPLPAENVPANFTGLVGEHKVRLELANTKFLVNEAIEARVVVEGEGELENLAPFKIYDNKYLESFDIKENVEEIDDERAKKIFDYTFLGRRKVKIPAYDYKYSFFDPESKTYKQGVLKLPALTIEGTAKNSAYSGGRNKPSTVNTSSPNESERTGYLAPVFTQNGFSFWGVINHRIKYVLICLIVLIVVLIIRRSVQEGILDRTDQFTEDYKKAMRSKDYASLYNFLSYFIEREGEAIEQALQRLPVKNELREYFLDLLKSYELQKFADQKRKHTMKVIPKHFKVLYALYYKKGKGE